MRFLAKNQRVFFLMLFAIGSKCFTQKADQEITQKSLADNRNPLGQTMAQVWNYFFEKQASLSHQEEFFALTYAQWYGKIATLVKKTEEEFLKSQIDRWKDLSAEQLKERICIAILQFARSDAPEALKIRQKLELYLDWFEETIDNTSNKFFSLKKYLPKNIYSQFKNELEMVEPVYGILHSGKVPTHEELEQAHEELVKKHASCINAIQNHPEVCEKNFSVSDVIENLLVVIKIDYKIKALRRGYGLFCTRFKDYLTELPRMRELL